MIDPITNLFVHPNINKQNFSPTSPYPLSSFRSVKPFSTCFAAALHFFRPQKVRMASQPFSMTSSSSQLSVDIQVVGSKIGVTIGSLLGAKTGAHCEMARAIFVPGSLVEVVWGKLFADFIIESFMCVPTAHATFIYLSTELFVLYTLPLTQRLGSPKRKFLAQNKRWWP
jgi:hypothetical protein